MSRAGTFGGVRREPRTCSEQGVRAVDVRQNPFGEACKALYRTVLVTLAATRQSAWEEFVNRSGLGDEVPADFAETIAAIADFAGPILGGEAMLGEWNPVTRAWMR